jgi:lysozyme
MNFDALDADLTTDEGLRLVVYDDATGKPIRPGTLVKGHPTIGIGRALDTHGLSRAEVSLLLENDTRQLAAELASKLPWFSSLNDVRQRVLAEMAFQLGIDGLLRFDGLMTFCRNGNFEAATIAMLASKWATQTPARAKHLAERMRTGA